MPEGFIDFSQMVEHIPAVVMRVAKAGEIWRFVYITGNIARYGYSKGQLLAEGTTWSALIHPDDREWISRQISANEEKGILEFQLYHRVVTQNGESAFVMTNNVAVKDNRGNYAYCDSVMFDVSLTQASQHLIDRHYRQHVLLADLLRFIKELGADEAVAGYLKSMGKHLGANRAVLYRHNAIGESSRLIAEWRSDAGGFLRGVAEQVNFAAEMPEIAEELRERQNCLVRPGQVPRGCKAFFETEGTLASAFFALEAKEGPYGFLRFDICEENRAWDEESIGFAGVTAHILEMLLERYSSAEQLVEAGQSLRHTLNRFSNYVIAVLPKTNQIAFANRAFKKAFGRDCEGKNADDYWPVSQAKKASGYSFWGESPKAAAEFFCHRTGQWLSMAFWKTSWADGRTAHLFSCYDITPQKLYDAAIEKIAFQDSLTGLAGRSRFELDLQAGLCKAKASGQFGCVLLLDIDDFKMLNYSFGTSWGNQFLIAFAVYLKELFEPQSRVYRVGGNQFAILAEPSGAPMAQYSLHTLLERAKLPWPVGGKEAYCSLSAGVAECRCQEDFHAVWRSAEAALYQAKSSGKNKLVYYRQELEQQVEQRLAMEAVVRGAMKNNFQGFQVLYQPVVDLKTRKTVGLEALLRLYNGDKVVLPGEFIPLADSLGLMVPIGEHVLRKAARECLSIHKIYAQDFYVTVNFSLGQLREENIAERVEAILKEEGADPGNIYLSFSERAVMQDYERARQVCAQLRRKGIRVILDDFGGGHASFAHLRELQADIIKISPGLADSFLDDAVQKYMELLASLSHGAQKRLAVNGIEERYQLEFCKACGVDEVQGFYFHLPCEIKELDFASPWHL